MGPSSAGQTAMPHPAAPGKQAASTLLCRACQAPAATQEPSQDDLLQQALAAEAAKQARRGGRQPLAGAGVQFKEVGVPLTQAGQTGDRLHHTLFVTS